MAGPAARPATGAAILHPNTPTNHTADHNAALRKQWWPDLSSYIAVLKRTGLDEDQAITVLLHENEIGPKSARRARALYVAAPAPPSYGGPS